MKYTIVVLTRAEADFNVAEFLDGIEEGPLTTSGSDKLVEPREGPVYVADHQDVNPIIQEEPSQSYRLIKKFLIDDIDRRVIGVNNAFKSEYEKTGMRDAVIELIDVVQSKQKGPFSDMYFDKAGQKLEKRKEDEEKARKQFEEEECELWQKLLEAVEKKLGKLLNKYCKDIQVKALERIRQRDNLEQAIVEDLRSFKTALSKVIEVLHESSDMKWPFNLSLKECVKSRLPKALEDAAPHMIQGSAGEYKWYKERTDTNRRQKEEIEAKLASMDEEIEDEMKEEEKIIFHQMKRMKLENEYALVRGYLNRVTAFETESSLKQMTLAKLHAESGNYFVNILADVRDTVRAHLDTMNMYFGMDFSDHHIKHLMRPVMDETIHDLLRELKKEEHKASYKGRLKWYMKKKLPHKEKRKVQESNEEEVNEYVKQAIEYLVNRKLSSIRQQLIPEKIDYRQMLEEVDVNDKKKTEYNSAFENLSKFYVERGEGSSTEQIQEMAEVHHKKLLIGLEENSEKRKELKEELTSLNKRMKDDRDGFKKKIHYLTYSLTNTVRDLVSKYAESKTKRQLDKIMKNDYEDAARQLSVEVSEHFTGRR